MQHKAHFWCYIDKPTAYYYSILFLICFLRFFLFNIFGKCENLFEFKNVSNLLIGKWNGTTQTAKEILWFALPLYHLCWNINVILKLSLKLQIFCVGLQILDIVPWLFYILGNRFPSTVPLVCLFLHPCIIYSWTAMSQKRTDMKHKKGEKLWINKSKGR